MRRYPEIYFDNTDPNFPLKTRVYVGQQINDMKVIKADAGKNKFNHQLCRVKCTKCGKEFDTETASFRKGFSTIHDRYCSLGTKGEVKPGEVYGDYTVIRITKEHHPRKVLVRCNVCGKEREMISWFVRNSDVCYHRNCSDFCNDSSTKFYSIWEGIRQRTDNPNNKHYEYYGGRGIRSDAWKYFIDFKRDMHESYERAVKEANGQGVSIERLDVNGNYCKENCKWILRNNQGDNKEFTRYFMIFRPDGLIDVGANLARYTREQGLAPSTLYNVLAGKQKEHKGYKGMFITKSHYDKYCEQVLTTLIDDSITTLNQIYEDTVKNHPERIREDKSLRVPYNQLASKMNCYISPEFRHQICSVSNKFNLHIYLLKDNMSDVFVVGPNTEEE